MSGKWIARLMPLLDDLKSNDGYARRQAAMAELQRMALEADRWRETQREVGYQDDRDFGHIEVYLHSLGIDYGSDAAYKTPGEWLK